MNMQEEKAAELAEFLGIDVSEIELSKEYENTSLYKTPNGEYTVMTEDEADYEHKAYIGNFIDECGIEGFTEEFRDEIVDNYLDNELLEDYLFDSVHNEIDNMSDAEVVEKAEELGLAWTDLYREYEKKGDTEKSSGLIIEMRSELAAPMVEDIKTTYDGNIADWIIDNYGREELYFHINQYPDVLDIDGISERSVELDGYGHNLAWYDGKTNQTENFYVFLQDDADTRSAEFLKNLEKHTKDKPCAERD